MKKLLLPFVFVMLTLPAWAQSSTLYSNSTTGNVGIGTASPVSSLDLSQKTDAIALPVGTTGQRPATLANGMMRYNSTTPAVEAYVNGSWTSLGPSGTSSSSAVQGTFKNLKITNGATPNNQMTITADAVMLGNGSGSYFLATSYSCTADITTSGAGGLDTGSVAASTWYSEWVIYNGSSTSCLFSTSATSPTMPSGYTFKARVGWSVTNSSSHFLGLLQYARDAQYLVGTNLSSLPTITSGTAGSVTTPTWSAVTVSGVFVPSTASSIDVVLTGRTANSGMMVAPNNSYGAINSLTNPPPLADALAVAYNISVGTRLILESSSIYYASGDSNAFLQCRGWEDNL